MSWSVLESPSFDGRKEGRVVGGGDGEGEARICSLDFRPPLGGGGARDAVFEED